MSHVLCPTELLRWHNEPPTPNGTRRAMLSLSAPDRCAEPEPLFEPRSRYSVDERRSGGRPYSFGTSWTRRCRPGGTGRGGAGHPVRGTVGRGLHPLRRRRAIEDVRAVKEHSGCLGIRLRGNKNPGQATCLPGFFVRETGGGCFFRGSPGRCSGDLPHDHTANALHGAERTRSALVERRHRHCPATRPACSVP